MLSFIYTSKLKLLFLVWPSFLPQVFLTV